MSKSQPPAYPDIGFVPAQNYQPQQNPPAPTVIITTGTGANVGPNQANMICPSCHANIITEVKHEATSRTHLWALCLCLFVCWPCVCVPYCMDSCQTTTHYCPSCHAYIGKYDP